MDNKGHSIFTLAAGLTFGVAAGLIAGLVIAPKLDSNTKKEIERVATDIYSKARNLLEAKLAILHELGTSIDQEKYKKLVEEVIANLKSTGEVTAQAAFKLGQELKADWKSAEKSGKASVKKTFKKVSKDVVEASKVAFKK